MAKAMSLRESNDDRDDEQEDAGGAQSRAPKDVGGVAGQRLKAFLERVERLEEERKALGDDVKDIYAEAKGVGFDTKIMKRVLKLRKMEPEKVREEDELLELYKAAIGMA